MRGNIFGSSKLDGIYFELIAPPLNSKSISHIYCSCYNAIAATARCHPLHSIVYQHNLFEVMHYIHPVAFIPLHFKFKMKTSVKINLKVLFVNNYDWTEPQNLWHFTNKIRIRAFQTRNSNFVIFSLISIASESLKIKMPLKMLLKNENVYMYTVSVRPEPLHI